MSSRKIFGSPRTIITHDGQILDGRNRLMACRIAGVEPRFKPWHEVYEGPLTPSGWILAENIQRRHLTDEQRLAATVALRRYQEEELARERQAAGQKRGGDIAGRGRPKLDSIPTNSSECYATTGDGPLLHRPDGAHSGDVRTRLAAEAGASVYKTQQALTVQRENPELLRDVVRGDVKLREAFKQVHGGNRRKPAMACLTSAVPPDLAASSARDHQDSPDGPTSGQAQAEMVTQAVRMILECLPHKAAITTHLRAHGGLTAAELGAAAEFLNSFKSVLIDHMNSLGDAGGGGNPSSATGYALPPAPDGTCANATDAEGVDSLDDFRL